MQIIQSSVSLFLFFFLMAFILNYNIRNISSLLVFLLKEWVQVCPQLRNYPLHVPQTTETAFLKRITAFHGSYSMQQSITTFTAADVGHLLSMQHNLLFSRCFFQFDFHYFTIKTFILLSVWRSILNIPN